MAKRYTFDDVISLHVRIKSNVELLGMTAEFSADWLAAQERLRQGLQVDHDFASLKPTTELGPTAVAAFLAYREWYASWSSS